MLTVLTDNVIDQNHFGNILVFLCHDVSMKNNIKYSCTKIIYIIKLLSCNLPSQQLIVFEIQILDYY